MWSGVENRLVAYADYATLFASVPSPHMRPFIAESLHRVLNKISAWCKLWGMKMIPTKTQCMTISKSRTAFALLGVLLTCLVFCSRFPSLIVEWEFEFYQTSYFWP